jgi:hypothetical protein
VALTCHVIKVETNMLLQYRFEAKGKVDLSGSKITGQLVCASGRFLAKGLALNCDAITVGVYVFCGTDLRPRAQYISPGRRLQGIWT